MAMNVVGGGGRGGGRRRGRRGGAPMAEINVTPFVDVMLVLLIIFMVAAPLLTAGVPLNLPKGQANPLPVDKQKKPLIVEIDAEGRIFVDKSEYPLDQLIAGVVEAVESRVASGDSEAQDPTDELLLLRADGDNTHARVSQVMALLNSNGFTKFGIVMDQTSSSSAEPAPAGDQ